MLLDWMISHRSFSMMVAKFNLETNEINGAYLGKAAYT